MEKPRTALPGVALLSPPWPLFNRPSIQLGALKAYLKQCFPQIPVTTRHAYLQIAAAIGYDRYRAISKTTWLAECVYAALLYPQRLDGIEAVFAKAARGHTVLGGLKLKQLLPAVEAASEDVLTGTPWGSYALAGVSICLCQLTAGLYFIQRLKRMFPHLPIVVGGSSFSEENARQLLAVFEDVDAVVCGEGERPMAGLVKHLQAGGGLGAMRPVKGVVTRERMGGGQPPPFCQLLDLDGLPAPDFDDYFKTLKSLGPEKAFFPTLPLEISRGCWWKRKRPDRAPAGCAFCNLNLQWQGYRHKSAQKTVAEISALTGRHRTLSVAFMDNVIPAAAAGDIFRQLAKPGRDFQLFCEIRANTTLGQFKTMKNAGVREVQIGIEALSTGLLGKLNKGTTAIENLEVMKNCETLGIKNNSNLILYFPGADAADVAETMRVLRFARIFHPLRPVHFWLGMGSPVWQDPRAYGIRAVFNHPAYRALLPPEFVKQVPMMIQAYRGDRGLQRKLWRPVKAALREWKKEYAALHRKPFSEPILSYRDGGEFIIIRQRKVAGDPLTHRLAGTSREIYLFCRHQRPFEKIRKRFPAFTEEQIMAFLRQMAVKQLMFEENGRYLSLASPSVSRAS